MAEPPRLRRMNLQQTNRPIDVVIHWSERDGGLYLDPPYQRGDVWGTKRRVNLIRSVLLGVPIPSMIINDRLGAGWDGDWRIAVIDGKQRITTLLMFLHGELPVPGEWFGSKSKIVTFNDITEVQRRIVKNQPLPFSEGRLATLEDEKEVFDLVNFGGLTQGESDV